MALNSQLYFCKTYMGDTELNPASFHFDENAIGIYFDLPQSPHGYEIEPLVFPLHAVVSLRSNIKLISIRFTIASDAIWDWMKVNEFTNESQNTGGTFTFKGTFESVQHWNYFFSNHYAQLKILTSATTNCSRLSGFTALVPTSNQMKALMHTKKKNSPIKHDHSLNVISIKDNCSNDLPSAPHENVDAKLNKTNISQHELEILTAKTESETGISSKATPKSIELDLAKSPKKQERTQPKTKQNGNKTNSPQKATQSKTKTNNKNIANSSEKITELKIKVTPSKGNTTQPKAKTRQKDSMLNEVDKRKSENVKTFNKLFGITDESPKISKQSEPKVVNLDTKTKLNQKTKTERNPGKKASKVSGAALKEPIETNVTPDAALPPKKLKVKPLVNKPMDSSVLNNGTHTNYNRDNSPDTCSPLKNIKSKGSWSIDTPLVVQNTESSISERKRLIIRTPYLSKDSTQCFSSEKSKLVKQDISYTNISRGKTSRSGVNAKYYKKNYDSDNISNTSDLSHLLEDGTEEALDEFLIQSHRLIQKRKAMRRAEEESARKSKATEEIFNYSEQCLSIYSTQTREDKKEIMRSCKAQKETLNECITQMEIREKELIQKLHNFSSLLFSELKVKVEESLLTIFKQLANSCKADTEYFNQTKQSLRSKLKLDTE